MMLWPLLVLCGALTSHFVQGQDRSTPGSASPTKAPEDPTGTADPADLNVKTARPSCRYNCGWDLGSCSCSSSCQYYGNCCYDYYTYCQVTTTRPAYFTTAWLSCRYNCGMNLGSCSCSSSCQHYGNCCYDYYRFCSSTTVMPISAKPCGASLHGSGSFTSPYYPSYYHDNAYCVWQLTTSYGQRIHLSFTEVQLEHCCTCDYITIYDGSSIYSPSLGKVCDNQDLNEFQSSSNYMTVVFQSDSAMVGRGFKAEFTSTLTPSSGRVECSSENMTIVISRSYLSSMGYYDGYSLYLNDPYCRPKVSSYQVIFSFPINTCGTERKFERGRVVYTNAVSSYTSNYGEITRQSFLKLHVGCRMEQDTMVQIMYAVNHDNGSIIGTGKFNGTMAFYTSSNFYYQVTQVPYMVTLDQEMYIQVRLSGNDNSLVIFLDTCVASPSPHDFHNRTYELIRDGCPKDNTYYAYTSGTHSYIRFKFKAFQFLRAHDSVYLQCKVIICAASDYNSRCRHGCNKRKIRDLRGSNHESHTLVLGPIKLKGHDGENPKEEDKA
ncbi:deleted in malignant brain tumors 1 protein-like [Lampris incognitus]|uniref:deleted in malignant brain tumors 1 protein-like n=1 Tax=Lampris incognitus TaxID=2546036 RepID=UPI0024B53C8C|nr:deleted in malignant brain tumors 1 protein-like [Lampris incognitus]